MTRSTTKMLASLGPANRVARNEETHPLTWRLRDDGQPAWQSSTTASSPRRAAISHGRESVGRLRLPNAMVDRLTVLMA